MKVRVAAVCLAVTFAFGVVRAHAQGPPAEPGSAASLAARIAALEARLTALGARVTALETLDESDIVGTWKWQSLGIEFAPGSPARLTTSVDGAAIILNADHSVQFSVEKNFRCTFPISAFSAANCGPGSEEEPVTLTWSFANGVVTISGDPEDGPFEFAVPANGVFVYADASEFLPGHSWSTIILLVKQ
jgi:hypothetical protein